ncbi:MAG: hypothetical protein CM1200mP2_36900 [Planctomycetaceae bacterium]|nr:MAG: hypothetical protein CM1200mP2_36900 [Planctomycetaceae bacterium]
MTVPFRPGNVGVRSGMSKTTRHSCCVSCLVGRREDWPHWRGNGRNGVVNESSHSGVAVGLPESRCGEQRQLRWQRAHRDRNPLYTMGWKKGRDFVYALERRLDGLSGNNPTPAAYGRVSDGDKGLYSGPSSCPSYDKATGHLYTLSTDGDLICWNTRQQGKRVWSLNFYDATGCHSVPRWGEGPCATTGTRRSAVTRRDGDCGGGG